MFSFIVKKSLALSVFARIATARVAAPSIRFVL